MNPIMRILKLIGLLYLIIHIVFFIGKSLNALFPLQEPKRDPILGAWYGEIHIDPPNSPSDPKPDNPDGTWNGFIGNDQVVRNSKEEEDSDPYERGFLLTPRDYDH